VKRLPGRDPHRPRSAAGSEVGSGAPHALLPPEPRFSLVGVATKCTTGWLAAHRTGIAATGRLRAGRTCSSGEFNIVIAGLTVTAGTDFRLGLLAAAYVLILAIAGPLLARTAEPFARSYADGTPRSAPDGSLRLQ
jgi:monovalent cation:H+ antiporter-2, CPA2 family